MDDLAFPERTVITGAAGWLGRALLQSLTSGAHRREGELRALVLDRREEAAVRAVAGDRVECVAGSVTEPRSLEPLFAGGPAVTDVIHAAGVIHPRAVAEFAAVNAGGTANVVAATVAAGARKLVHISSNSPFGANPSAADTFRTQEPYHPYLGYGSSKMAAELAVLEAVVDGLDAVIVRPVWFYGPFQPARQTTFFRMVRTGRFPRFGDGRQRRSMVYVDNLVQGVVRAELTATAPGAGYWIADARAYTVEEIVATVGRALRAEGYEVAARATRLPVLVGRAAERADRLLQSRGIYQQQLHVLGEMAHTIACDISAAVDDLGYAPTVELYDGMRRSIQWCRREGLDL
jgi:nucleoside-diphosphate-sugar epimerase